jgi:hypothetical protein
MKMLLLSLSVLVLGFGCARESNNSSNNNNIVNTGYQMNTYGQCVQTSTGQIVQSNLCTNGLNTGYQLNQFGQCVQASTGQQVQYSFCQQGNTGVGQQCYGNYMYNGQIYACGIQYNCSGYTVTNPQTGQSVYCK